MPNVPRPALHHLEPVAYGEFEHLGHLHAVVALGDVVDELGDYARALHHLVHAHLEAGHRVAFLADDFVELKLGIDAVGHTLAYVAGPA